MRWYGLTAQMLQGILVSHLDNDESVSGDVILEKFKAINMQDAEKKAKEILDGMQDEFPGISLDDVEIIEIIDKDMAKTYAVMVETNVNIDGINIDLADAVIHYTWGNSIMEADKLFKETMLYSELKEKNIEYKLMRMD